MVGIRYQSKDKSFRMMETTTFLVGSVERVLGIIKARAKDRSLNLQENHEELMLTLPLGELVANRESNGLRLTLRAEDEMKLHLLQENIDNRLDEVAVALDRQWSRVKAGSPPPNLTFAAVVSCIRISPSYYRISVIGNSLDRFLHNGLHFRVLFPPNSYEDQWPYISENGRTDWPGGIAEWHRPVYTTRKFDAKSGILQFDVFSHDGGRVSEWCKTLTAGMNVAIMGPGGEWFPEAKWLALFGDETGLPAIARILESLPDSTEAIATIIVPDTRDIQTLTARDGISVRWLTRDKGLTLIDALRELTIPDQERFVWFASERSEVTQAREMLLARGLHKSEIRAASYWTR